MSGFYSASRRWTYFVLIYEKNKKKFRIIESEGKCSDNLTFAKEKY